MIIIADFSKTFTTADMPTTWSVFAKSGILDDTYIKNRNDLYEKYFPKEQLHDVDSTEEWFLRHMELLVQSGLTLEQIDTLVMDDTYFAPRAGVYEFLQEIQKQEIPLYIVSSGIKTCIDRWFQLRYDFVPDIVIANEFTFKDGKIIGVDEESIICSLDKSIELEFEHWEENILLLGDNSEDTKILSNPRKSIWFTDEERGFDVNLGRDADMQDVIEYI